MNKQAATRSIVEYNQERTKCLNDFLKFSEFGIITSHAHSLVDGTNRIRACNYKINV